MIYYKISTIAITIKTLHLCRYEYIHTYMYAYDMSDMMYTYGSSC